MLDISTLAGLAGLGGSKTDVRQNVSNSSLSNLNLTFSNQVGDGTSTNSGSSSPRQSSSASGTEPLESPGLGVFGAETFDNPNAVRDEVFSTGTTGGFLSGLNMTWVVGGVGVLAALVFWFTTKKKG